MISLLLIIIIILKDKPVFAELRRYCEGIWQPNNNLEPKILSFVERHTGLN